MKNNSDTMKIRFLGTAAAEGWPALFCKCDACNYARAHGGKNIRSRSQILVNDDLLVDFPPDTYYHELQYGLDLERIRTLLVTHSHDDHFYPYDLMYRGSIYGYNIEGSLDIFWNESVDKALHALSIKPEVEAGFNIHIIRPFAEFESNGYRICSLKARHMVNEEDALFYLISKGGKTFLQCNDTGRLYEENYEFLEKLGVLVDCIALDCTRGARDVLEGSGHMCIEDCRLTIERMRNSGFTHENTQFVVTHFSHNGLLHHEALEDAFRDMGVLVAYDGMEMEV